MSQPLVPPTRLRKSFRGATIRPEPTNEEQPSTAVDKEVIPPPTQAPRASAARKRASECRTSLGGRDNVTFVDHDFGSVTVYQRLLLEVVTISVHGPSGTSATSAKRQAVISLSSIPR